MNNLLSEKFVPIEGYESRYEISNYGNVRSSKGSLKILSIWNRVINGHPCPMINLRLNNVRKKFCIKRLVYHHFVGKIDNYCRLKYKDKSLPFETLNHVSNIKMVKGSLKRQIGRDDV